MADLKLNNFHNLILTRALPLVAFLAASVTLSNSAHAIIIYDQTGQQTTAPADGEGFQYVGSFHGGAGVVVGPNLFLTADHLVGNNDNDPFLFQGQTYNFDSFEAVPGTNMFLFHTTTAMPSAGAPLYFNALPGIPTEVGKTATIIGDGGPKGSVYIGTDGQPHGWSFSLATQTTSYGSTTIDGVYVDSSTNFKYLGFAFTATPGSSMYSAGDSGGGMFIQQNGVWTLAGINIGIDGYYTDSTGKTPVDADLYTLAGSGLFEPDPNGDGGFQPVTAADTQHGYASEITPAYAFLESQIARGVAPEPASLLLLGTGALTLLPCRRKP